jgi:hypothetical protein
LLLAYVVIIAVVSWLNCSLAETASCFSPSCTWSTNHSVLVYTGIDNKIDTYQELKKPCTYIRTYPGLQASRLLDQPCSVPPHNVRSNLSSDSLEWRNLSTGNLGIDTVCSNCDVTLSAGQLSVASFIDPRRTTIKCRSKSGIFEIRRALIRLKE